MITMDWANIGYDVITLVITFIIITILAYIALWIIDKGLPEVDFTIIQNDPKAEAIGSLGWMIIYSLVFAGALIAPFSLDTVIVREIIWTFIMLMVASVLTIIAVRFCSPYMRYSGKDGLKSITKEPIATAIFYLGSCILIGIISFSALTA
jgi:hypothetical protein